MNMKARLARLWTLLALALAVGLGAAQPAQADTLYLNDGRVLEGRVEREGEGFIYFVIVAGGIEHMELFTTAQIKKLERDEDAPEKPANPSGAQANSNVSARTIPDGATRVTFISLEEMVGPFLNADALRHSVELVKDEKPDIIVLVVNSGGGALTEVQPLSDLIHKELKKDYRVVAWIRSAISAAAMTSLNCEEIYMMREGNIGAAVAFMQTGSGTKALEGEELEQVLVLGERISSRGKRNPLILRAMQVWMELSCDIDENGIVTWYDNLNGKYIVNPKDRILTLNAVDAEKYGLSRGTADTKEELARLMGLTEWVEVGFKADEYQQQFRANVKTAQARANELMARYNLALQAAGGAGGARYVGQARQIINELRGLVRRAPSMETYNGLTKEWFAEREEELRRLAQQTRGR